MKHQGPSIDGAVPFLSCGVCPLCLQMLLPVIAVVLLYFNVMGSSSMFLAWLRSQGLPEDEVGLARSAGAIAGRDNGHTYWPAVECHDGRLLTCTCMYVCIVGCVTGVTGTLLFPLVSDMWGVAKTTWGCLLIEGTSLTVAMLFFFAMPTIRVGDVVDGAQGHTD